MTLEEVGDGQKGLVLARGPGIMRGYYNDAEATRKVMRAGDGWFDTGDLGWRAPGSWLALNWLHQETGVSSILAHRGGGEDGCGHAFWRQSAASGGRSIGPRMLIVQ